MAAAQGAGGRAPLWQEDLRNKRGVIPYYRYLLYLLYLGGVASQNERTFLH